MTLYHITSKYIQAKVQWDNTYDTVLARATYLRVAVDGRVMQGCVVVQALRIDGGSLLQQQLGSVHKPMIARLVQSRPAWQILT